MLKLFEHGPEGEPLETLIFAYVGKTMDNGLDALSLYNNYMHEEGMDPDEALLYVFDVGYVALGPMAAVKDRLLEQQSMKNPAPQPELHPVG